MYRSSKGKSYQCGNTKDIPTDVRNETRTPTVSMTNEHYLQVLASSVRQEKEHRNLKKQKVKLLSFVDDMILYQESSR